MNFFKRLFSSRKEKQTYEASEREPIEEAFSEIYPGQVPKFWQHNGVYAFHDLSTPPENPLSGVTAYDAGESWHFVSLGLTQLPSTPDSDLSGFGYEFTLKAFKNSEELEPPFWPIDLMISLAKAQYSGTDFIVGDTIECGSLNGDQRTAIVGLFLTEEINKPGFINSPYGSFEFIRLVGITEEELLKAKINRETFFEDLKNRNPELVTRV